jgi:hypothetical protein
MSAVRIGSRSFADEKTIVDVPPVLGRGIRRIDSECLNVTDLAAYPAHVAQYRGIRNSEIAATRSGKRFRIARHIDSQDPSGQPRFGAEPSRHGGGAFGLFDLLNPDCNDSLMSSLEHFQNVVLCGGEAGKYIVWEWARWGQRVAVVEKGLIGGSCPTTACLPGKNVLVSREVDHGYRRRGSTSLQEERAPYPPADLVD